MAYAFRKKNDDYHRKRIGLADYGTRALVVFGLLVFVFLIQN